MASSPYLDEPIALLLGDQLSAAITTAQAMAENALACNETISATTAWHLHQKLVELEACVARAMGPSPIEP